MKNLLIVFLGISLVGTIVWIAVTSTQKSDTNQTPQITASASPTNTAVSTPQSEQMTVAGTVTGKLCYPSQFLPEGTIEAKNISTNESFTQKYVGSQKGGASTYTLDLEEGTYIFRYRAEVTPDTPYDGFHTKTCPTGIETTCAQANKREHIQVVVKAGENVNGVDLCDFYYDTKNPPTF